MVFGKRVAMAALREVVAGKLDVKSRAKDRAEDVAAKALARASMLYDRARVFAHENPAVTASIVGGIAVLAIAAIGIHYRRNS